MAFPANDNELEFLERLYSSSSQWDESDWPSFDSNPSSTSNRSPIPGAAEGLFNAPPLLEPSTFAMTPPRPFLGGTLLQIPFRPYPEAHGTPLTVSPDELTQSYSTRSRTSTLPETPPPHQHPPPPDEHPELPIEGLGSPFHNPSHGTGQIEKARERPPSHGVIVQTSSKKRSRDTAGFQEDAPIGNGFAYHGSFDAGRDWEGSTNHTAEDVIRMLRTLPRGPPSSARSGPSIPPPQPTFQMTDPGPPFRHDVFRNTVAYEPPNKRRRVAKFKAKASVQAAPTATRSTVPNRGTVNPSADGTMLLESWYLCPYRWPYDPRYVCRHISKDANDALRHCLAVHLPQEESLARAYKRSAMPKEQQRELPLLEAGADYVALHCPHEDCKQDKRVFHGSRAWESFCTHAQSHGAEQLEPDFKRAKDDEVDAHTFAQQEKWIPLGPEIPLAALPRRVDARAITVSEKRWKRTVAVEILRVHDYWLGRHAVTKRHGGAEQKLKFVPFRQLARQ